MAQAVFNPVDGNLGFDVMIHGDAALAANESEGAIAIGGDLIIGAPGDRVNIHNLPVSVPGLSAASNPVGLLVAGGVNWAASAATGMVDVLNGKIKVADLTGAQVLAHDSTPPSADGLTHVIMAPAEATAATPQIKSEHAQSAATVGLTAGETLPDFGGAFTTFEDRSAGLAQCADNVALLDPDTGLPLDPQVIPASGRVHVRLTAGVQNVLSLTAGEFAKITEITFESTPSLSTPLIVNVSGSSVTWPSMTTPPLGTGAAPYILWNMPEASQLTRAAGDSVEGTIYAPQADFTDTAPSNVEGDIIAASLDRNGGEYHHAPFASQLTSCEAPAGASLAMTKTVTPSMVASAGTRVTYSFTVTSTGMDTITGISIVEGSFSGDGSMSPPDCPATTLASGESTTCTAAYTLDQADIGNGRVTNTARAAGTGPGESAVFSPADTATVTVTVPPTLTPTSPPPTPPRVPVTG